MAETSGIAWTRSTFNPWIGCTKIGPGCDGCYAEVSRPSKAFGIKWGSGQPRHRTGVQNWNLPLRWNRLAGLERETGKLTVQSDWHKPGFWPVFCASLADVFDNDVPDEWRKDIFDLIEQTPNLSWLLVTKRIGNVPAMAYRWLLKQEWPANCRLMITVVNQEEADRDIPKLLALPCKNGISYEPALGPVDWMPYLAHEYRTASGEAYRGQDEPCGICGVKTNGKHHPYATGLEWIIVGGESSQPGHPARAFNIDWARSTVQQCKAAGVPVFVKQMGSHPLWNGFQNNETCWPNWKVPQHQDTGDGNFRIFPKDRAGADPAEWQKDLRVREFPTINQGV